jgi:UDP-N-acetylmuramyl pentapeptide synthase
MKQWLPLCVEKNIMVDRPLWTTQELVAATGGTLHGEVRGLINGVSIDSRAVSPGDVFVAIKGDKLDGHDFVVGALKNGAGFALVSRVTNCKLLMIRCVGWRIWAVRRGNGATGRSLR